ncbi:hypothetical protein Enr13x_39580 [Stieleria neptunia]|uniref:Phage integrase family protein n=1 Tax=Stieleria neptunia TaxID=2527979 RepID=A0A518HTH1_9BACT|nr:site-specific integrase [Stieleria neptunia]QDV44097.1 hypothetical protein Enr13x_39580 [Stieleria neptunia]
MPQITITQALFRQLDDQTDYDADGGHWKYPGSGKITIDGKCYRARQLWWAHKNDGQYPTRMGSICKVAGCCNPDHWFDASKSQRPPCTIETEVKYHSRHGYYYVANNLTGGRQVSLGKDRAIAVNQWREGRSILQSGLPWSPITSASHHSYTVGAVATAYRLALAERLQKGQVSPEHVACMKGRCDRLVKYFGAKTLVAALTPKHFDAVSEQVMISRVDGSRRNWKGYQSEISKMRHILTWARKQNLLPALPDYGSNFPMGRQAYEREANRQRRTKGVKITESRVKLFQRPEITAMLDVADDDVKAWIYIGLNLALENKELSYLCAGDFSQDSAGEWWFGENRIKSGEPRLAHVWPETIDAVKAAMKVRPEPAEDEFEDRLFLNAHGRPLRPEVSNVQFTRRFRSCMELADCYKAYRGFQSLRHTFRTYAGNCGDTEAVEWVMGHETFGKEFTRESSTYTHAIARTRLMAVSKAVHDWLTGKGAESAAEPMVQTLSF